MLRLCICLLVSIVLSTSVGAREVKMSSPNSGGCKESVADKAEMTPANARIEAARETRAKPSVHSDASRLPSPRWHRFLPGMFR
ncbi:hypothetical protein N799_04530 [Lysobacter arseniciresistens ZS79]|uniref:Secreted protein n=1 Tax=Lysobacter arseniciresistens ZS79 TaxID=913325 RepID=A0A0A0F1H3_9GAMM|nr:hypothetical protein [Lysobacter arseniciresistens]KGM56375.1 hypothetical protein N799_04530 [Lysobacter arseniciresistens ZS79]